MNDAIRTDTIVAIASAPGAGGVGLLRLSGPRAAAIANALGAPALRPRHAHYARLRDADGEVIDDGIVLWFPAPNSFTGEEVVELQGHGSPVLLQQLVARCIALGARQARPGEFSERAFLNGKLDLAQAEAIADLIAAGDNRAARAARRSLDGVFSRRIDAVVEQLVLLRIHVEAAIDFADEPLDTLGGAQVRRGLEQARSDLALLRRDAERGRRLRDGLHAVLIGPPNAGKSSLLNALAGSERAIVTDIAGTTRDTLRETIRLDGLELTLVDTAGLRDGGDAIEREGMRRAHAEIERTDLALIVLDARDPAAGEAALGDAVAAVPQRSTSTTSRTCWRRCRHWTIRTACSSRRPPVLAWKTCIPACVRLPRPGRASRWMASSPRARAMWMRSNVRRNTRSAPMPNWRMSTWNWLPRNCGWRMMRWARSPGR